ncbi:MAG: serine/threonine-protein kinase [Pseudomonadota bacterium]
MPDDNDNELSFDALDALLDEALALDGEARAEFLANLSPSHRDALSALLEKAESGSLSQIGTTARSKLRDVAAAVSQSSGTAGSWQLKREIGSGGTGQVFYGERREQTEGDGFVQRAAIKVLWSHRVASQFRERFLRERRILASIDHPGIARFLDGGLLGDGRPWFAMEYVAGQDIVSAAQPLPIEARIRLFLAVVDTIDYAHQRLIVHRDIKPQNVLVDELGQPRVLDFGIARILDEFDEKDLTRSQGTPVTLQYASPEQVTGMSIDVASDVYQLGLLLFEILTGKKPYSIDEQSLRQAVETICSTASPAPSAQADGVGRDLDAIVAKALHKKPGQRYRTAAAMAEDLRRFLEDRPVTARPPALGYVLSLYLRRNALLTSVIAASVVALTFATAFSIRMAYEARAEAQRSQTAQRILADVFEQADPYGDGGASITLADALIRARPLIDEQIAGDPRLAWEVNKTLAEIFTSLDLTDMEREAYGAAWDAALELEGDNEKELLFAIAGEGNLLVRTDPVEAIEFFAEHLPPSPTSERSAVDWLSAKYAEVSALIRLRDYEAADTGARDMARVAAELRVSAPRTLGRIDQLLAGAARRAGETEAADEYWDSAVRNMRRADAPLGLAVTLSNQALHFGMTDRYEDSEAAFEESIAVFREHSPDDSSHANVLRLYAGLLFRMRRPEDALDTLDQSLSILDPSADSYPYFIAQLNRAGFSFASGKAEVTFDALANGLDVAFAEFGPESDVTQRMFPVFARLLLFADRAADAARLLGLDESEACAANVERTAAIEDSARVLNDAQAVDASRQAIWATIARAEQTADGSGSAEAFTQAVASYRDEANVFIDALDRRHMLDALMRVARKTDQSLPADLQQVAENLTTVQAATVALLNGAARTRLAGLLDAIRPPHDCTTL